MKMTVEVDDGLAREAEARATERGETLGGLIERVLGDHLRGACNEAPSLGLLTKLGRPVPGVDIDSQSALYDLMDARD